MATAGRDKTSLGEDEIDTFTDVMLSKLALLRVRDDGRLDRDEIRTVIEDTVALVSGRVPLEGWVEAA